jgi:2-(1,2-epoxy-1,2-dihydrophenyl)acetyl-CoA isomerase
MSMIKTSVEDGIATVTLARPERKNAMSAAMLKALYEAILAVRDEPSVKALVLTGEGSDFCSGGDISAMQDNADAASVRARMAENQRVTAVLADFNRPVVAAVDGAAFGAGFSIALQCDFVIASERARFCLAFSRMGLVPDLGAAHALPRIVGMQRAKELIYSAREIGVTEALALGLVLEVHPVDRFAARARELAQGMASMSAEGFAMTKQLLAHSFERDLGSLLQAEASAQAVALTSPYLKEAASRFVRKEAPLFQWPVRQTQE